MLIPCSRVVGVQHGAFWRVGEAVLLRPPDDLGKVVITEELSAEDCESVLPACTWVVNYGCLTRLRWTLRPAARQHKRNSTIITERGNCGDLCYTAR